MSEKRALKNFTLMIYVTYLRAIHNCDLFLFRPGCQNGYVLHCDGGLFESG